MKSFALLMLFCLTSVLCFCQKKDSLTKSQKVTLGAAAGVYVMGSVGLYQLWYADFPTQKFKLFNDNDEWLQVDKVGHFYSAYGQSQICNQILLSGGFSKKKAALLGFTYSYMWQTTIEVMDGFSAGWGASWGDLASNSIGSGLFLAQHYFMKEPIFYPKFTSNRTNYFKIRPNLLGNTLPERAFKDYNGQTYWLTMPLNKIIKHNNIPQWIGISIGYGANGMVGAEDNIWDKDGIIYNRSDIKRYRQFYLAPDILISKLPIKNKNLKRFLNVFELLKVPLPTLVFQNKSTSFKPLGIHIY